MSRGICPSGCCAPPSQVNNAREQAELLRLEILDHVRQHERTARAMEERDLGHVTAMHRQRVNRPVPGIARSIRRARGSDPRSMSGRRPDPDARRQISHGIRVCIAPLRNPPVVDAVGTDDPFGFTDRGNLLPQLRCQRRRRMDEQLVADADDRHARGKWHPQQRRPELDQGTIDDPQIMAHRLQRVQRRIGLSIGLCHRTRQRCRRDCVPRRPLDRRPLPSQPPRPVAPAASPSGRIPPILLSSYRMKLPCPPSRN